MMSELSKEKISDGKKIILIFINIIKTFREKYRYGAELDKKNLIDLFENIFHSDIDYHEDLTSKEFYNHMENLVQRNEFDEFDSFFLCIASHGTMMKGETYMKLSDGKTISVNEIVDKFSKIPSLQGKQKIFFIYCCRTGKRVKDVKMVEKKIRITIMC